MATFLLDIFDPDLSCVEKNGFTLGIRLACFANIPVFILSLYQDIFKTLF